MTHLTLVKPRPALTLVGPVPDTQTALDALTDATRRYVHAAIAVAEALLRDCADCDAELDAYVQARAERALAEETYRAACQEARR